MLPITPRHIIAIQNTIDVVRMYSGICGNSYCVSVAVAVVEDANDNDDADADDDDNDEAAIAAAAADADCVVKDNKDVIDTVVDDSTPAFPAAAETPAAAAAAVDNVSSVDVADDANDNNAVEDVILFVKNPFKSV